MHPIRYYALKSSDLKSTCEFLFKGTCTPHFYECVENSPGHLTAYEFYCPAQTVFDVVLSVCNYPWLVEVSLLLLFLSLSTNTHDF